MAGCLWSRNNSSYKEKRKQTEKFPKINEEKDAWNFVTIKTKKYAIKHGVQKLRCAVYVARKYTKCSAGKTKAV